MHTFTVPLTVTIRPARQDDLRLLEWFGLLTPFRETIEQAFARAQNGEIAFLVAEVNGFPAGQVWVNLVDKAEMDTGVIWALRVLPPLRRLGIGTQLLHAAEQHMRAHGLYTAELNVALDNPHAKRLYERCGYRAVQQIISDWQYTTPDGETHRVAEAEYIMHKSLSEAYP